MIKLGRKVTLEYDLGDEVRKFDIVYLEKTIKRKKDDEKLLKDFNKSISLSTKLNRLNLKLNLLNEDQKKNKKEILRTIEELEAVEEKIEKLDEAIEARGGEDKINELYLETLAKSINGAGKEDLLQFVEDGYRYSFLVQQDIAKAIEKGK